MKTFLTLIASLSSVYLAGDMIRQNEKLDAFLSSTEQLYSVVNRRLSKATITDGLRILQRLYGLLAFTLMISFVLIGVLGVNNSAVIITVSTSLVFAGFAWFSILWCLDHKKVLKAFLPNGALLVLCPLGIGFMDLLLGSNFASIIALPLAQLLETLHFQWQLPSNPIALGAIAAAIFFFFALVQYAIAWILCFPFAAMAAITAAVILWLAKAIDTLFPKKPFVGFVVFLLLASTLALVYI